MISGDLGQVFYTHFWEFNYKVRKQVDYSALGEFTRCALYTQFKEILFREGD